jgi:hypothetical protein
MDRLIQDLVAAKKKAGAQDELELSAERSVGGLASLGEVLEGADGDGLP